jgi:hypothetical protein
MLQGFNGGHQVTPRIGLQQETPRSNGQHFLHDLFGIVHGQNQNASLRQTGVDLTSCIEPVQARHPNIKQDNVWFHLVGAFDGFASVFGLATNLPPWVSFEEGADTSPHHFVIIRD